MRLLPRPVGTSQCALIHADTGSPRNPYSAAHSDTGWYVAWRASTLRRFYLLFFIDIPTRTVYFAGTTDHPTGVWVTQAARNLFLRHADGLAGTRALVRDRGNQFIDAFDEIFRTERMKILKTPVRTPVANAFAERWIGMNRTGFVGGS